MKTLTNNDLYSVAAADGSTVATAVITTASTATGTAIGTAIAGPVGAIIGSAIGSGIGAAINGNKTTVLHALGSAAETVATNYGKGHKDAHFNGMPMAYQ